MEKHLQVKKLSPYRKRLIARNKKIVEMVDAYKEEMNATSAYQKTADKMKLDIGSIIRIYNLSKVEEES